ncbi:MAG: radical SAM protein [Desulfurococcaceae archaeon]
MKIAVVDALARAMGKRYSTFDVVGAGPRHIAGIAEKHGDVFFFPYEKAVEKLSIVRKFDVVMVSAMSSDYIAVKRFVSSLRRFSFKGTVVVGGPVSFEYAKLLQQVDIDYVVIGEGEIPTDKLLEELAKNSLNISHVPSIAYRVNGHVKVTSSHIHTPKDILAKIKPWTAVDRAFEHPQVYRFYVEVVRGCSNFCRPMLKVNGLNCIECYRCRSPNLTDRLNCPAGIPPGCGFCSVPYMFGYPRSRPITSIVREVEELVAHGARRIVLSGPDFLDYMREELVESGILTDPCTPPPNLNSIEELLNELNSIEMIKNGKAVVMIENIKACLVNEEVGRILGRYLRGTTVHIGLETGCDWYNDRVLGKPISVDHVVKACKILSENGLRPYVYLMHSLPLATSNVYEETVKSLEKLQVAGVEKITFYKFINLPATAFERIKPTRDNQELIFRIKKLIDNYNASTKKKLIGKHIEVYFLESGGKLYGYPVKHGPVVFVKTKAEKAGLSGCRGLVKVVDVKPRYIIGVLYEILEC